MNSTSLTQFTAIAGTVAGALLLSAGQASAFTFETQWTGAPPKGDIMLDAVKIGDRVVTEFALVNSAVLTNTPYTGGNSGAASSDRGDNASGINVENPNNAQVVSSLGNLNLNNIIDTEDSGAFSMDLTFDKAFDSLLFWERGINSSLGVTINGITKVLTSSDFAKGRTTFSIDTTEIGGAQRVGSYGLNLTEFGVNGKYTGPVTLFSRSNFRGPDFKVVGVAAVPEPATVLGLTAVAGAFVASRRRKSTAA